MYLNDVQVDNSTLAVSIWPPSHVPGVPEPPSQDEILSGAVTMLLVYPPTQPGAAVGSAGAAAAARTAPAQLACAQALVPRAYGATAAARTATAQLACPQALCPRANGATAAAVGTYGGVGAAPGAAAGGPIAAAARAPAARGNEAETATGSGGGGPVLSSGVWLAGGTGSLAVAATASQVLALRPVGGSSLPSHAAPIPPALLHTQHIQQTAPKPQHPQHQLKPLLGPVLYLPTQNLAQFQTASQGASRGAAAASFWRLNPLLSCMGAPPYVLLPATTPVLVRHPSAPNQMMLMQAADSAGQLLAFARPAEYGGIPSAVNLGRPAALQASETAAVQEALCQIRRIAESTMPLTAAAAAIAEGQAGSATAAAEVANAASAAADGLRAQAGGAGAADAARAVAAAGGGVTNGAPKERPEESREEWACAVAKAAQRLNSPTVLAAAAATTANPARAAAAHVDGAGAPASGAAAASLGAPQGGNGPSQNVCFMDAACWGKGESAAEGFESTRSMGVLGAAETEGGLEVLGAEGMDCLDNDEAFGEGALHLLPGVGGGGCGQLDFQAEVVQQRLKRGWEVSAAAAEEQQQQVATPAATAKAAAVAAGTAANGESEALTPLQPDCRNEDQVAKLSSASGRARSRKRRCPVQLNDGCGMGASGGLEDAAGQGHSHEFGSGCKLRGGGTLPNVGAAGGNGSSSSAASGAAAGSNCAGATPDCEHGGAICAGGSGGNAAATADADDGAPAAGPISVGANNMACPGGSGLPGGGTEALRSQEQSRQCFQAKRRKCRGHVPWADIETAAAVAAVAARRIQRMGSAGFQGHKKYKL